jgi:YjbE family integral membrane protein
MSDYLLTLGEIILLNILLSGDNAIVIGMASRNLNEVHRRRAILAGGLGAVGLRIIFTFIITILLDIPFIHLIGGALLLYISWTLLKPESAEDEEKAAASGLWPAIVTIIMADAVMSLDNVVAITAAADGDFSLLVIGVALSIPIVLFGSDILSRLLSRFPILIYLGVLILILTAVEIAAEEEFVHDWHPLETWETAALTAIASVVIFGLGWMSRRKSSPHDGPGGPGAGTPIATNG